MFTNNLKKIVARRKKRIGRGGGSGKGFHTVGKGQKGQTSRGGYHARKAFEGGQNPISRRVPMRRGYKSNQEKPIAIRLSSLLSKDIFEVDSSTLKKFSQQPHLKLVGDREYEESQLKKVVIRSGVKVSRSLKERITSAGGKVEE